MEVEVLEAQFQFEHLSRSLAPILHLEKYPLSPQAYTPVWVYTKFTRSGYQTWLKSFWLSEPVAVPRG